jgi:hypothetical protein
MDVVTVGEIAASLSTSGEQRRGAVIGRALLHSGLSMRPPYECRIDASHNSALPKGSAGTFRSRGRL